jgi:hypothetical protein
MEGFELGAMRDADDSSFVNSFSLSSCPGSVVEREVTWSSTTFWCCAAAAQNARRCFSPPVCYGASSSMNANPNIGRRFV